MRYLLPLFIFLLIMGFLWKGLSRDPHQLQSAIIGKPLPEFQYPDLLNPQETITQKEFTGQVSLLNVWATWCITCHIEHALLMDIVHTQKIGQKIAIYGLNYKDDPAAAREWLEKYGNPFKRVIADPKGALGIELGVYGTPETFVIDAKGIVRYRTVGAVSPNEWREKIEPEIQRWRKE